MIMHFETWKSCAFTATKTELIHSDLTRINFLFPWFYFIYLLVRLVFTVFWDMHVTKPGALIHLFFLQSGRATERGIGVRKGV